MNSRNSRNREFWPLSCILMFTVIRYDFSRLRTLGHFCRLAVKNELGRFAFIGTSYLAWQLICQPLINYTEWKALVAACDVLTQCGREMVPWMNSPWISRFFKKTRLHSNVRLTTHECVHLVTRNHFRSCDKMAAQYIRSAGRQNLMLHANFMALCYRIGVRLFPMEVLHCGNMYFLPFLLEWPWPWPDDLHI